MEALLPSAAAGGCCEISATLTSFVATLLSWLGQPGAVAVAIKVVCKAALIIAVVAGVVVAVTAVRARFWTHHLYIRQCELCMDLSAAALALGFEVPIVMLCQRRWALADEQSAFWILVVLFLAFVAFLVSNAVLSSIIGREPIAYGKWDLGQVRGARAISYLALVSAAALVAQAL